MTNINHTPEGDILMSPQMFEFIMEMAQPSRGKVEDLAHKVLEDLANLTKGVTTVDQLREVVGHVYEELRLRDELNSFIQGPVNQEVPKRKNVETDQDIINDWLNDQDRSHILSVVYTNSSDIKDDSVILRKIYDDSQKFVEDNKYMFAEYLVAANTTTTQPLKRKDAVSLLAKTVRKDDCELRTIKMAIVRLYFSV